MGPSDAKIVYFFSQTFGQHIETLLLCEIVALELDVVLKNQAQNIRRRVMFVSSKGLLKRVHALLCRLA
jgi:hypothetical protein